MKKMINAVFVSLIVLAMTACGNKNQVGEASPPVQTPEAVVAAQNAAGASDSKADAAKGETEKADAAKGETEKADSKADADRQETGTANNNGAAKEGADSNGAAGQTDLTDSNEAPKSLDDDYQNPTMNFIGPYVADGVNMDVSASGKRDAEFKVSWSKEDSELSVWTMSGELNADTFTVEYSNCEKKDYILNEDGSIKSETSVYDDGTGRIIFNPQDGTLVWEDEKEHAADALIFEFNYSVEEAEETGELG